MLIILRGAIRLHHPCQFILCSPHFHLVFSWTVHTIIRLYGLVVVLFMSYYPSIQNDSNSHVVQSNKVHLLFDRNKSSVITDRFTFKLFTFILLFSRWFGDASPQSLTMSDSSQLDIFLHRLNLSLALIAGGQAVLILISITDPPITSIAPCTRQKTHIVMYSSEVKLHWQPRVGVGKQWGWVSLLRRCYYGINVTPQTDI